MQGLRLCQQTLLSRALPAGMIDGVLPFQNDLRNGDKGVSLLQQAFNDPRQRLRGVLGSIVEQHNRPGAHLAGHPFGNVGGGEVFPVQAVAPGSICKGR